MAARNAAAAHGGRSGRRRVGDGVRPRRGGQPGAQAAVPDRRRRLRVRQLDRAHRRDIHRRPVRAGRRDRRKPLGAMGSADHPGIRGRGQTPHRARVQGAHPDGQDNGAPPAGPVRRAGGARRRPARARRLDRQRQPQLGHAAHSGLRVRPGVRLRRRAGLEPGDRDGAGRDRTGLAACGHAVRVPARRPGVRGSLDPRQPADPRPVSAVLMGVRGACRGPDDRGRDHRRAGRRHRPDLYRHRWWLEVLLQLGDRDLPNPAGGQGFRAHGS